MAMRNELAIPDAAKRDTNSLEVLRVWVANGAQHVSLLTGFWREPEAWGIMLADLARHVANAYEQDAGLDPVETLEQIRAMMEAEFSSPTDRPTGFIT
jgi:hypothetical protein